MNLHFNNEDIQIIHTKNGHTDGDSFIYFKNANVIHTGDALRTGGFPYVDVSSGGTFQGLIDSTDQLANLCNEETAVIQGHGSLSTKEEVIWVRDRLQSIKDILQAGIAEGKTADDLVNEKVLKDFAGDGGFIKSKDFITIVYDELAAQ
jgi:glyoxylase-like metal-dependent hydrolase (beta-lactamase superfamily II)